MALAFYDAFDRSDGPVGDGWTVDSGTFSIYVQTLRSTVQGQIHPNTQSQSENAYQRLNVATPAAFPKNIYLRFRQTADQQNQLTVYFSLASTSITVQIQQTLGGSTSTLSSRTLPYSYGSYVDLSASCVGDLVTVWVDLIPWLSCRNADITGMGTLSAIQLPTATYVEDYWLNEYSEGGYGITVGDGPDENGYYELYLTNGGAPWSGYGGGGGPFTAVSGTLGLQTVTDDDNAVVLWKPPDLVSEDAIVDNTNSYLFHFGISAPPGLTGPSGGSGGLTSEQAETLSDLSLFLGDYQAGGGSTTGIMLKLGALVLMAGTQYSAGDGSAMGDLLDAVLNTTDGLSVIANRIALVRAAQDALTSEEGYSLASVQEAIRGSAARDLTAVYNLIAALDPADPADVTEILNAILAIRTANLWTLDSVKTWIEAIPAGSNQDVLNELALIRTANNWTLGHLMDAIQGIAVPDYADELSAIDAHVLAIPTDPIRSLQPVLDAVAGVRGSGNPDLAAILAAIGAIPTNPITDLSSVISAINTLSGHLDDKIDLVLAAIAALVPGQGTPAAPVWPGLSGVTLGSPIAIAQTFAFSGPCDGVLVNLTSDPNNHGVYSWGSVTQYPRAGYLSFVTDNGDYSDVVPFSFPTNVLPVVGMLHADGFIGRARPGATGTVTPWSITVP